MCFKLINRLPLSFSLGYIIGAIMRR